MPVIDATYVCGLTAATAVPGQAVFGGGVNHAGVILETRPHPYRVGLLECRVRWAGGTERWYDQNAIHDYDKYLDIIEAELVGLYDRRLALSQKFGIPLRPPLVWRP